MLYRKVHWSCAIKLLKFAEIGMSIYGKSEWYALNYGRDTLGKIFKCYMEFNLFLITFFFYIYHFAWEDVDKENIIQLFLLLINTKFFKN